MTNQPQNNQPAGFLLINKPAGITSHDVINRLRKILGIKKIGHAGTLDPFATGLLICAVGRSATKQIGSFKNLDKTYLATLKLGQTSDTFDKDGKITGQDAALQPPIKKAGVILKKFLGKQLQTPPMYSAKKINGRKLYQLARAGQEITREPVEIEIKELALLDYNYPYLKIRVTCTPGTYIRSLGHDIGQDLKTGAYLEELTRTQIGSSNLEQSLKLEEVTADKILTGLN